MLISAEDRETLIKYDENQPGHPKGTPEGGKWKHKDERRPATRDGVKILADLKREQRHPSGYLSAINVTEVYDRRLRKGRTGLYIEDPNFIAVNCTDGNARTGCTPNINSHFVL